ncbi:DUF4105 domain-containing protein [Rubricoccus marinus]|uniref:Uncharacterized protein n=1 Tax=Rubricoccus marinus TaxID=716817 RepID=A0A259TV76_9BACT|nr:DUF4105 domain-containing protein [Rubricoccus marinus]OZC01665.1 hypothetical protein BSZ36_00915 [Rubricoccus marinus]
MRFARLLLLLVLAASGAAAQPGRNLDALLAPEADPTPALSDSARVSLLTMLPGEEVYSAWGHSAFRIQDPATGLDKTYNYGTFDFNQPGFVVRFLRGHLDYILDTAPFENEVYKYQLFERPMIEQVLDVSPQTVRDLYAALEENAKPENRAYRYDFVRDNCSTRLVDMLDLALAASGEASSGVALAPPAPGPDGEPRTFRDMLNAYTEASPWLHLGTNLGIGVPADEVPTPREATFLPLDLMRAFDDATVDGRPLVAARDTVFWVPPPPEASFPWPLALAWALLAIALGATLWMRRHLRSDRLRRWGARADGVLFALAGLAGVVLLLMWFASDHSVTEANLELLWLWPTHLLAAFGLARLGLSGLWRGYAALAAVATLAVVLLWWLWPEPMHAAGIPLALLLAFRAGVRAFRPDL